MARPIKPRLVAEEAPASYFKPQGVPLVDLCEVVLTLDGFEALRYVDADGLDQTEAARRMGVSRSTLSRILGEARRTLATAITRGLALRIDGGVVSRREGSCGHAPRATITVGNPMFPEGRALDAIKEGRVEE